MPTPCNAATGFCTTTTDFNQSAIRAPNVLKLYQGGAVGFPTRNTTVDPCLLPDTMIGSQQNSFTNTYDALGQRFFISTSVKF